MKKMSSYTPPTMILSILFSVILSGCSSHEDPIKVEPVVFSHADEMVRNEDFIILADRRVFTVMAFMNACGYDKQINGIPMHPVRICVREAIRLKAEEHPHELAKWKGYYRKKALPNFCYLDYALSLCDDYPFRRIRPDSELGYRITGRRLTDFPDILNKFWETIGLEQIWA